MSFPLENNISYRRVGGGLSTNQKFSDWMNYWANYRNTIEKTEKTYTINDLNAIVKIQNRKIEDVHNSIEELIKAENESREQIQALIDFCNADRSKWKEGQSKSNINKKTQKSIILKSNKI